MEIDYELSVIGLDQITRKTEELVFAFDRELGFSELERLAELTLIEAQKIVPVLTGALRSSLRIIRIPAENRVIVGTDIGYGKFVEFGTSRMSAQPFLYPAALFALRIFKQESPGRIKEFWLNARK